VPILITVPPTVGPVNPPTPVDDRELDFRSLDGGSIIRWTGGEYVIQSGIQGLDIPPRDLVTEEVPGLDGSRLRQIKTQARTVVLPFFVISEDGQPVSHRTQLAALRRYLDYRLIDYAGAEGTFDLVAKATGGERLLRCTYVDGMDGLAGVASGDGMYWSSFDTKLLAVQPYWRGLEWSTPVIGTGLGEVFVSDTELWPRSISSSIALGADMSINVGGDIPSPPSITITGPVSSAHITSPQGLDVSIGAIGAGHVLQVDTGRDRNVTLDGVPAWDLIGDSPRWRPLPPGVAIISITVPGATVDTSARVYGTSLWETAW
jgi:hypothetical protein